MFEIKDFHFHRTINRRMHGSGCVFTLYIANLLEILLEEFEELEEALLRPGLVLPVKTNNTK